MKKSRLDFVQDLIERHGYTKKSAVTLVDDFLDTLIADIEQGDTLSFSGFGRFELIERKAHYTRNLQTGERIDIPPHLVIKFHPGIDTKCAVKKYEASVGKVMNE